jgi:hypothetical protein
VEAGTRPFIVPAMGSHGGATAAGQAAILEGLGLTETAIGVPIRSSMEVCRIGKAAGGFVPQTKLFTLPFLFTSRDEAYKILDGPIGTEVAENLLKIGIRSLGWYENGFRHITNNVRPINSLYLVSLTDSKAVLYGLILVMLLFVAPLWRLRLRSLFFRRFSCRLFNSSESTRLTSVKSRQAEICTCDCPG